MPAIVELGTATGFDFELIDQGGLGHDALTKRVINSGMVAKHPDLLVRVRPNGLEDTPQFKLDVDQEKRRRSVFRCLISTKPSPRRWAAITLTTLSIADE